MTTQQIPLFDNLPTHKGNVKALRTVKELSNTIVVPDKYVLVQTDEQLQACVDGCVKHKEFAFDTETTGVTWFDRAVGLSITYGEADDAQRSYFIPTDMIFAKRNFTFSEVNGALAPLFADKDIRKVAFNMKFDMHKLVRSYGITTFNNMYHDGLLAQWILNENERHSLEAICEAWLNDAPWKITNDGKFHLWPLNVATVYACNDSDATLRLYRFQEYHLKQLPELRSLLYDVEIPHLLEVYRMEQTGISWDTNYAVNVLAPEITNSMQQAELECRKYFGNINLDSPQQLAAVVFDGLKLSEINGRSLAKEVLIQMRYEHPAIDALMNYRKFAKAKEGFVDVLPQFVDNGRIHPDLQCIGARTGRLACKTPNLQNLPKQSLGPIVRRTFIPSRGNVLVTIDYSQVELRLLAHFSQDEALLDAFRTGKDIHAVTMARISDYTLEDIIADKASSTPSHAMASLRVRSKTINFGILYGMGPTRLMNTINAVAKTSGERITYNQAQDLIDLWYEAYPGVLRYKNRQERLARKQGFVTTLLGRKRRLPAIRSNDRKQSSGAERQAVNAPIQGSAADMMKVGVIRVAELIRNNHWPFRLLLQVHDELIMEVPQDWLHKNKDSLLAIQATFTSALLLSVPVVADFEVLSRWGDKFVDDSVDILETDEV